MFKDREKSETLFGVLFGIIAITAAIAEMVIDSFSLASIAGAIKDIAGTAIVFVVMLAFINEHKKAPGIRGSIEKAMEEIEKSYTPLIRQAVASETSGANKAAKLEKIIRYEIAANTDALFGTKGIKYSAFFDIAAEAPNKIEFYIRKKFFGETEMIPFDANEISKSIDQYMKKHYSEYNMEFNPDTSGGKFIISFSASLKSQTDVDKLIKIIDDMAFVYVALKQETIVKS